MARERSFILPSGVKMTVRELTGKDQGTITKEDTIGKTSSFNQMLADCTRSIGDNTNVSRSDIEKMLSNDRKNALVELRQFSLRYKETFDFNYEWPLKNGMKETQECSVIFDRETFKPTPYIWVRKAMEELSEDQIEELNNTKMYYPELYTSYEEMLADNLEREFFTDEGVRVLWNCCTGKQEEAFSEVEKKLRDVNLPIRMRNPKKMLVSKDNSTVPIKWDFESESLYDVENFRKEMRSVEGYIDTVLTIQHETDNTRQQRVDLVSTIDFFFPSQAI